MNAVYKNSKNRNVSVGKTGTKEIFLIEDDRIISKMLETILKRRGYSISQFFDGNEAIDAIEKLTPPNLILLDIVLPYINGYRILEKMCATKEWKDIPKIMITSNSNEANIVRAFEIGADDYITKPIQIEELVVRINRFLR